MLIATLQFVKDYEFALIIMHLFLCCIGGVVYELEDFIPFEIDHGRYLTLVTPFDGNL